MMRTCRARYGIKDIHPGFDSLAGQRHNKGDNMYDFKFFTFVWIMMILAIVATLLVLKIIGAVGISWWYVPAPIPAGFMLYYLCKGLGIGMWDY